MPRSVTEKISELTDSSMRSSFDACDRSANQRLLEVLIRGRGGLMPGNPGFRPNTEKPTNRYIILHNAPQKYFPMIIYPSSYT
jgi:hypothetical protein